MINPYPSIKAAIGAAAHLARPLDYPAPASTRVQSVPDGDAHDRPVAARAVLVSCGLELDSEDAEILFAWAVSSDEPGTQDYWDELAERARSDREYLDAIRQGAAGRRRLEQLLELVGAALLEAGVVRRPPKLKLYGVGYMVIEDIAGRRSVRPVIDPSPLDHRVLTGPTAETEARRIARGEAEGVVVTETVIRSTRKHPDLAAELGPAWEDGRFGSLPELDAAVADHLGCSPRYARIVRASWGIHGTRGAAPTRPPLDTQEKDL